MTSVVRNPRVAAVSALIALAAVLVPLTRAAADGPVPLVDGVQQAYRAGGLVNGAVVPSTAVEDYEGEHLSVQAVRLGTKAIEPTLGVDKSGAAFFAAAGTAATGTKIMRSTDGGATWQSAGPTLPNGQTNPPITFDPYVYVDESTGRVFTIDLMALACSYLSFSDNQGSSWTTNPLACGQPVNDHQTIVAGRPVAGLTTVGYPNVIYYCFNRVTDSSCSRSLDGGLSFTPTGTPSFPGYEVGDPYSKFGVPGLCGGLHGHAVTDHRGWLYIPKSHCGLPTLAVSEDGGTTWRRTVVSTDFLTGSAHVGEHHSVAVDDAGNVYYLYWDDERRLPWLAVSTDGGKTFGKPLMVAPPGVQEINLPALVAGEAGKIAFQFPGTTSQNRDDRSRPWNSYMIVSTNALEDDALFLSVTANPTSDPIHRGNCQGRCAGMYDFLDIVASPADGGFWAAVTDTCTGTCASKNGSASDAQGVAVRQMAGPRIRSTAATGTGG